MSYEDIWQIIEYMLIIWGAGLSTLLAVIKIQESRIRMSSSYFFYGTDSIEDVIVLYNRSSIPIIITHWELLLLKRRRCIFFDAIDSRTPDEFFSDITILPHGRHEMVFGEQDSFPWGKEIGDAVWYLKLHIVGRYRPKWLRIYPKRRLPIIFRQRKHAPEFLQEQESSTAQPLSG